MPEPRIQLARVGETLPKVMAPFAVLIDTSDEEWTESSSVKRLTMNLLRAGCRYFVCSGPRSELVHDLIDDVIVEYNYDEVTTTFHEGESNRDVAEFFDRIAVDGMNDALVFVRDTSAWNAFFCDRS